MSGTPGPEQDASDRRRAREALIADRAAAARSRGLRRVGLRSPSALPAAERSARGELEPGRPEA